VQVVEVLVSALPLELVLMVETLVVVLVVTLKEQYL
tara:strand:- start:554 stop:661 length:108 start_codon:yes stop_codon:yes gene_type:complete